MGNVSRIGMIGLDTSHVEGFAKILNEPDNPHHVAGGRIVAGWPGGSPDFELSIGRVEKYTNMLRDDYGVEIMESPEAVAEACDLIFIMTIDGRVHADLFERVASYGKPVFIDKPLAVSVADAERIMETASASGVALMSCSSLRYADNFQAALASGGEDNALMACDVYGPMNIEPPLPGLFWYGIHTVEMLVAALGVGCRQVQVVKNTDHDLVVCEWVDGRVGVIHGMRNGHHTFGATLHRKSGAHYLDIGANERPFYASMLEVIVSSLPEARSDISNEEMLDVIRIIEAANQSRESGQAVRI